MIIKELWYPDIKANTSTGDYNAIAASAKWIAVSWSSAGTVGLLNIEEVGKRKAPEVPLIHAHSAAVTDLQFDPFDDSVLATAGDDSAVKLWSINDAESGSNSSNKLTLSGHKKRVDCIQFHPNASNILASGSSDKTVKIWDLEAGKEALSLDGKHDDVVHSVAWNWNGDLLATVAKDKKIRIFDPRSGQLIQSGEGHQGVKASRVLWLGEQNKLFTTGFNKTRERQIAIWDGADLSKSLVMTNIDNSTGVLDVYFDNDSNLLYLAGKGDGGIKIFEMEEKAPHYREMTNITSDVAQKSTAFIPKRACDLLGTEIARILKLGSNNSIVPVSFSVPRKSKTEFQDDLYPPTRSNEAALSGKEWLGGDNKPPKLVQLKPKSNPNKFWFSDEDSSKNSSSSSTQNNQSSSPAQTSSVSTTSESPSSSSPTVNSNRLSVNQGSTSSNNRNSANIEKYEAKEVNVVRSSKYRHIIGKGTKPEACFTNLKAYPAGNNSVLRGNSKYFSVPLLGVGGRIGIVNVNKPGKQPDAIPSIECGSDCLDFDFSPFNENLFATTTESALLQLWKIPEGGLTGTNRTADQTLKGHTRRVTAVDFHPTAENVIATSAGDHTIRLWDIEKGEEKLKNEGPTDAIMSISWNWDGSIYASASKDKMMRIHDPRAQKISETVEAHDGVKGFKTAWLGNRDAIATVGFSRGSQRQIALWDLKNLSKPLVKKEIDNGAGVMTPYFDQDTGVMFLSGKGDGNIKMFEIEDSDIHHLTDHTSSVPTFGLAQLPKISCDVRSCEIAKFYKLCGDYVEILHFTVPRTRAEFFQDDLFPPTRKTDTPSVSAGQWFSGVSKPLETVSMQPSGMKVLSENPLEKKEKKYDFNAERNKTENQFSKEKFLDKFYAQTNSNNKEEDKVVLKQDLMEGVDASEWDD